MWLYSDLLQARENFTAELWLVCSGDFNHCKQNRDRYLTRGENTNFWPIFLYAHQRLCLHELTSARKSPFVKEKSKHSSSKMVDAHCLHDQLECFAVNQTASHHLLKISSTMTAFSQSIN